MPEQTLQPLIQESLSPVTQHGNLVTGRFRSNDNPSSFSENSQLESTQVPSDGNLQSGSFLGDTTFWIWAFPIFVLSVCCLVVLNRFFQRYRQPYTVDHEQDVRGQFKKVDRFRVESTGVGCEPIDQKPGAPATQNNYRNSDLMSEFDTDPNQEDSDSNYEFEPDDQTGDITDNKPSGFPVEVTFKSYDEDFESDELTAVASSGVDSPKFELREKPMKIIENTLSFDDISTEHSVLSEVAGDASQLDNDLVATQVFANDSEAKELIEDYDFGCIDSAHNLLAEETFACGSLTPTSALCDETLSTSVRNCDSNIEGNEACLLDARPNTSAEFRFDGGLVASEPTENEIGTDGSRTDTKISTNRILNDEQQLIFQSRLSELQNENNVLKCDLQSANAQYAQLVQTLDQAKDTTERLEESERSNVKLQSQLEAAKLRLECDELDSASRLAEKDQAHQIIQAELDSLRQKLETETAKASTRLIEAIQANEKLQAELASTTRQFETETAKASTQINEAIQANNNLQAELVAVNRHFEAETAARMAQAERANSERQDELESVKQKLESEIAKSAELDELRSELAKLFQENATLSIESAMLKSELSQIESNQVSVSSLQEVSESMKLIAEVNSTTFDDSDQTQEVDPQFLGRYKKRLKAEYKKRKLAQKFLKQAEEQRDELAKELRETRRRLEKKDETRQHAND